MFFRKSAEKPTPQPEAAPHSKGRPTPTRKESQAARQRPIVQTDRKAAKAAERARRDELLARQHHAMTVGDERYMPQRDRGKVRRFVRDYVDARFSIGETFLPLVFVILLVMVFAGRYPGVDLGTTIAMYLVLLSSVVDSFMMLNFLNRQLRIHFTANEIPPKTGFYAFQRSFMVRRFRMPKPMVKRGQFPQDRNPRR